MDALVAVSLEKGYDDVTIRDIAERADVAYSTFFRHYAGKDDLLVTLLKSAVGDFKAILGHHPDRSLEEEGRLIFQLVAEQQSFFRVLFSSQGTGSVLQRIRDEIAADILAALPPELSIPREILANHIIASTLELIRWWLVNDRPYSVERMGAIYAQLMDCVP